MSNTRCPTSGIQNHASDPLSQLVAATGQNQGPNSLSQPGYNAADMNAETPIFYSQIGTSLRVDMPRPRTSSNRKSSAPQRKVKSTDASFSTNSIQVAWNNLMEKNASGSSFKR